MTMTARAALPSVTTVAGAVVFAVVFAMGCSEERAGSDGAGAEAGTIKNEAAAASRPQPESPPPATTPVEATAAAAANLPPEPPEPPEPEPPAPPDPEALYRLMRDEFGPRLGRPEARRELVGLLAEVPSLAPPELESEWRAIVAATPEDGPLAGVCTQCHTAHRLHFRALRGALPVQRSHTTSPGEHAP